MLSDGAGNQVPGSRVRYLPYGGLRLGDVRTLPTDYTFTGQRWDSALGLYDYRARFYDPAPGRFLSPDIIIPDSLTPQDLNRYAYARNNPLAYIDRDGHNPIPIIIGLVVVGFIAYDYLAHPDIVYAPGPDVDISALPPGDLPDNDAAICAPCPYVERGQWGTAFVMGVIEFTPLDEVPGVNQALRKVLREGGEEIAEEAAERGAKAGREAIEEAEREAQSLIDDIVQTELKNVRLFHYPQYDPAMSRIYYGEALPGRYTRVGPLAIEKGRREALVTIVHEEMHHRVYARQWRMPLSQEEAYVERIAQRFARMKGW